MDLVFRLSLPPGAGVAGRVWNHPPMDEEPMTLERLLAEYEEERKRKEGVGRRGFILKISETY